MGDVVHFRAPENDHERRRRLAIYRIRKSSDNMVETSKSINQSASELRQQQAKLEQSYALALKSEARLQRTLNEVKEISSKVRENHLDAMETLESIEQKINEHGDDVDFAELEALVEAHKHRAKFRRS